MDSNANLPRDENQYSNQEIADNRRALHIKQALGPLIGSLLTDPEVTDIYLNPPLRVGEPGTLFVVRQGRDPEQLGPMNPAKAKGLILAVAGLLDTTVTKKKPYVEGELFWNGPRFEGLLQPAVVAPTFAIRCPTSKKVTLADYVASGSLTERQRERIEQGILRRENMIVVGGTGSGKTTLINAIADGVACLTPVHRLVLIEGARELQIPCSNVVSIRTDEDFDERLALRAALRLFPDRIWVGEVRGPEVLDMMACWNTGHPGGVCSLHSNTSTPGAALLRIEQMAALATQADIRRQIAETINLIVCLERDANGQRRVAQMVSVQGWAGDDYCLNVEN